MASEKISKEMTLGEIVSRHPEAAGVMLSYGLHCVGCHVAAWETLEQGAKAHGLTDKQIEEMTKKINDSIEDEKEHSE